MHLPASTPTVTLTPPSPTPSLASPGDCFLCGDPSDTILLTQLFIFAISTIILMAIPVTKINLQVRSHAIFLAVVCAWWFALIVHATLKFWMDEWVTSRDREYGRPLSWKTYFVYSGTNNFQILAFLPTWIVWGVLFWLVWRKMGRGKEVSGGGEEADGERRHR